MIIQDLDILKRKVIDILDLRVQPEFGEFRNRTCDMLAYLFFLVEVRDDSVSNADLSGRLWDGDAVEVFLDVLNAGEGRPGIPRIF